MLPLARGQILAQTQVCAVRARRRSLGKESSENSVSSFPTLVTCQNSLLEPPRSPHCCSIENNFESYLRVFKQGCI